MHLVLKMGLIPDRKSENRKTDLKIASKFLPGKSNVMNVIVVVGWMNWLDWIS